jgi:hypothetical protein
VWALIAAVTLVVCGSTVCGAAVLRLSGGPFDAALDPPVGFALLLAAGGLSIRLPGGVVTCDVVLGALVAAAVVYLASVRIRLGRALWMIPVAAIVVLVALIPFAAVGHVGLLGVGTNDDMAQHLLAAWTLQGDAPLGSNKLISAGYPIGPHAIAAVISSITGMSLERSFTGLIVAVPALLSLAAMAVMPDRSRALRAIAGVLVGLCYLPAAYLVQASFKEPMEATLLVGFAAAIWGLERTKARSASAFIPLAVLAAGSVYANSYLGLVWPVGTLLVYVAAKVIGAKREATQVRMGGATEVRITLSTLRPPALLAGLLFLILIAPELPRMVNFAHSGFNSENSSVLGNLLHRLSPLEATGIWPRLDFRFSVPVASVGGVLAAVAAIALLGAVMRSLRRRDFVLLSALIVSAGVVGVTYTRSPYTAAKALAITAPLVTVLLAREALVLTVVGQGRRLIRALSVTVLGGLLAAGAYSSLEVLRDGPVGPSSHAAQLAALRTRIGHEPTLFMGADDYAHWELRGARVATPPQPLYAKAVVPLRRAKAQPDPSNYASPTATTTRSRLSGVGLAFDFASVPARSLNRFTYAILPRSGYSSPAPPNWKRVKTTRSYELWRRMGETRPYRTLQTIDNPGAVLRCDTPAGLAVARDPGIAMTEPAPVVGEQAEWRGRVGYAGRSAHQSLSLGAGQWDLSLQYDGAVPVTVRAAGLRATLPANLEPLGPYWYVGQLKLASLGSVRITVTYHSLPRLGRLLGAVGLTRAPAPTGIKPLGRVTASRPSSSNQLVPLSQACGRYVDWYHS